MRASMRMAGGMTLLAVFLGAGGARPAAQVVAEVGSRRVTLEDLKEELQEERASGTAAALARSVTPAGRAEAVDRLVARHLMAEAATRDGLAGDPDVKARIDRVVSRILAAEYERRLIRTIETSEDALRAYYEVHSAEFQDPPRVRARHILLATREEAAAVRVEIARGADFAALARARSVDRYSRENGGDLGWISAGTMVKSFEDALFALEAGATSDVVESTYGFHLIRVDEVQPGGVRAFALVRDEIRGRVLKAAIDAATAALKKDFPVTVYPDALKALER